MPNQPPNLLLIMADQLGAQWMPAYGHGVVRTPHLSALAERSAVFDAAYCASPLCAPSRASLLTGKLPSRTGVFDNAAEMRASLPTVTHRLRERGYRTRLAGKMHFVGPDQLHGFEARLTPDIYPADLDWTPDWQRPLGDRLPWYHTMDSVLHPGVSAASMQQDYDDEVAFAAVRELYDLAREGPERPFFLTVSFTHPHDPWELRRRYWEQVDPDLIEGPAVGPLPLADADPASRRLRTMYGVDDAELSPEQVRRARHAYYAAIAYLDERVGEVLSALGDAGLAETTSVVFTADHGEMLGERGLWYKMAYFEPSARVPLFIHAPGQRGGRVAEPVSLLDVAPTLLELTQDPEPAALTQDMDGTSLLGLLSGPPASRGAPVAAEYLAEGVTAPSVMLRCGRHKLVVCAGDPDVLHDLEADPLELVNLATDPEHAATHARMRAEVESRWDLGALEARVLQSQRERQLVVRALGEGRHTSWDFMPPAGAATRYVRSRGDLYALQRHARLDVTP